MRGRLELSLAIVAVWVLATASPAGAIPAFARKYETSCQTCHTVFPRLNAFGEAFRRNGFRFPGIDSDAVKQERIPLGQEAQRQLFPDVVWPNVLPASVPLSLVVEGAVVFHPDTGSSAAREDNGAEITLQELVEELAILAGGSFSETATFLAEVEFAEGEVEIEKASVWLNDLIGPRHAVNLRVGRLRAALSTFGPHSSYLVDSAIPRVPVTALFGAQSDSWRLNGHYDSVELNGVLGGRVDYALGVNAGANEGTRLSESVYAHAGYKLGGRRLDGEGSYAPGDPMRPWEETALTAHAFGYRSVSSFVDAAGVLQEDEALAAGGGLRVQWKSLELDSGVAFQDHDGALAGGGDATALSQWNEISYVVFPWLVPAARFEYVRLDPSPGESVESVRVIPGVAGLVFANLKLSLIGRIEWADGAPPGGWGPSGAAAEPEVASQTVDLELESIELVIAYAY